MNTSILKKVKLTVFARTFDDYFFNYLDDQSLINKINSFYPAATIHLISTYSLVENSGSPTPLLKRAYFIEDQVQEHLLNSEIISNSVFIETANDDEVLEVFQRVFLNKQVFAIQSFKLITEKAYNPIYSLRINHLKPEYIKTTN